MASRKKKLLSEMVTGRIKQLIIEKDLRPGDRLPTEHEMARRFGVSRISVREATKALGFLGIIRGAPRRGLTLGEVDLERATQYLGFHLALNQHPKLQLLEARVVIETGALSYAMEHLIRTPGDLADLEAMISRMARTVNPEHRIEEDCAFHRALLLASRIEPLVVFNDLLQVFFNRFRKSLLAGEWKAGVQDHKRILEALMDRRIELAREILRRHIEYHKLHLDAKAPPAPRADRG